MSLNDCIVGNSEKNNMAHVTADWNPLGEVFYRKIELYSMGWKDVDLSKYKVAAAPYGGPIALIRDDSKLVKTTSAKPIIYIFSASGHEISIIKWNSGHIIHIGWSCTDDLLCVQEDGSVLVYDIFGRFKRHFSMGQEAKETQVLECEIFRSYSGTGVAVLTNSYKFFVVNNVDEPRTRTMANIPSLSSPPTCWAVISEDRQTRILLARDNELFILDHGGQYSQETPQMNAEVNAFISMSVSFNNKYLAMFTDSGLLWIGSADLRKVYCEFNTKSPARPQQLVWCGTGAIVGYWENLLLMVGPDKDWVKYNMDTEVHLVPELDGLRIIGRYTHDFLQRVPTMVESVFKIGSMAPGAMLYEASKEFQKGSQKADEYIRMIKDKLQEAVEQCIVAAGAEHEPKTQRTLLRAASFGKCFLNDMRPEAFVNMCQMLRVLNAVRDDKIGMPLTYQQLEHLRLSVLIDRLVFRHQWCLAIRICKYLKLPEAEGESRILAHWACYKVEQKEQADEQIARAIQSKLGDTPGISYSEIAAKASECGRKDLAIRLLDFEPKAAEQVPLLMKMKKDDVALMKAIESGDTDLVYTVLLHLKDTMLAGDFLMTLRNLPVAQSLWMQYCREQNRETLTDLYYQNDDFMEIANSKIIESYRETRLDARLKSLYDAQDYYTKARTSQDPNIKAKAEFAARQTEEQVKLMRYQKRLEEELQRPYLDLSLNDTMHELLVQGNTKLAEQLRKEFKVPDKRFWWLKIGALGQVGDWIELDRFSKNKKSPIGYEPFVEVCMKYHNRLEASKYLARVAPENRVKMCIKVGDLKQAAHAAFQQKSEADLNAVLKKCGPTDRALVDEINSMRSQLTSKR
ncbi:vacuolar protein sorting-associated protein 16 homolog [Ptychodera flava]|uniref:vacuolar protein sorting-associated protein 16 homolog n=1 Tax=Ptychodera flava TaxID=63121 RepID=UPI00396AADA9